MLLKILFDMKIRVQILKNAQVYKWTTKNTAPRIQLGNKSQFNLQKSKN